jgi:hypothetical protein
LSKNEVGGCEPTDLNNTGAWSRIHRTDWLWKKNMKQ